jgi:cellulose synthase/poly-beta-1,6-N-acetylglucosamine synthase-like glycosyltransferase
MIYIIITSYNEPKSTERAIKVILKQKIKEKFKIIVADPFPEVFKYLKSKIKSKSVEYFLDPGEGKNYTLNILFEKYFSKNEKDLLILTDGDVFLSDNAINEVIDTFKNKKIGCITGKPVCSDSPDKKYGYWAKVMYAGIDKVRKKLFSEEKFFQCSGYLFAFRNGIVLDIPFEVPEDAIIPYIVWKKGYKIGYCDKAEVYVKYPDNWKEWVNQRVRTIKAHENIPKFAPDMPRTKSFFNEIKSGLLFTLTQIRSIKQFFWMMNLYFARVYIYYKAFSEMKKKNEFNPAWRESEIQSTKPLD